MTDPSQVPIAEMLASAYVRGTLTPQTLAEAVWLLERMYPDLVAPSENPAALSADQPAQEQTEVSEPTAEIASEPASASPPAHRAPVDPAHKVRQRDMRIVPARDGPPRSAPRNEGSASIALAESAELSRTMCALHREVRAPGSGVLDVAATVRLSAEAGTLVPVSAPVVERWLELAVVIDTSISMSLWRPTLIELTRVLRSHQAFRDVRIWSIDGDTEQARLHAGPPARRVAGGRSSAELTDPTGRRLILIVTDGVGQLWQTTAMATAILEWADVSPLMILNVLPERLWHRTGLPAVPVSAHASPQHSGLLRCRINGPRLRMRKDGQRLVPVVGLDPERVGQWASAVAGDRTAGQPMMAVPLPRPQFTELHGGAGSRLMSAAELVKRFRLTAASAAYTLATFLSAAPLTVPVMRLIQRDLVPDSGPADLAEVFLSGLLVAVPGVVTDEPDQIVYDFAAGLPGEPSVREELLANLPRTDGFRVLDLLAQSSEHEAGPFGGSLDFRTLVSGPLGHAMPPPETRPFAEVVVAVLNGLGGPYRELAESIVSEPSALESRAPALPSDAPTAVALFGGGSSPLYVLVGYADGALRVFDVVTGGAVRDLAVRLGVRVAAVAALNVDGRSVVAACWSDGVAGLWDITSGDLVAGYSDFGDDLISIAYGEHQGVPIAVASNSEGRIQWWDLTLTAATDSFTLATAEPARSLQVVSGSVLAVRTDGGLRAYPLPPRLPVIMSPDSQAVETQPDPPEAWQQYRALSIGVSSFGGSADGAPQLSNLPFAADRAAAVAAELSAFGYEVHVPADALLGRHGITDLILTVSAGLGPGDILVVHVISHGYLSAGGSLSIIGSDGVAGFNTIDDLVERFDRDPQSPSVLFLLDLCSGGVGSLAGWRPQPVAGRRAWLIASTESAEPAFEGQFSRAVAKVLRRLRTGDLDIDRTARSIPLATVGREVRRELANSAALEGVQSPQITASLIDIATAEPDPAFFLNGAYSADQSWWRASVDKGLLPFLDDLDWGLDARHFMDRAARYGSSSAGLFTGRHRELRTLSAWLDGLDLTPLRVVTGSPGVGKSALLGALVVAHPALREPTRPIWQVPHVHEDMAVVHARHRTTNEIFAAIGRQLGAWQSDGERWNSRDFLAHLTSRAKPPVVIIDALDEAYQPVDVLRQVLLPLATTARADGRPVCRLLVATRPWPEFKPLLKLAAQEDGLINLDTQPDAVLRDELEQYISALAWRYEPDGDVAKSGARAAFATTLADTLAERRTAASFLVANLYTHHVVSNLNVVLDIDEAVQLGRAVPSELSELVELDIAAQDHVRWLRPLLVALSHAHGEGMPSSLAGAVAARAFGPGLPAPTTADVNGAIQEGRRYLCQSADEDGRSVYRLFHQSIAGYLRARADSGMGSFVAAQKLFAAMLDHLDPGGCGQRQWELAEPYLLRHAMGHAVEARRADELWLDVDFVVRADPWAIETFDPSDLRSVDAQVIAEACRSIDDWAHLSPAQRAVALRVAVGTSLRHSGVRQRLDDLAAQPQLAPAVHTGTSYTVGAPVSAAVAMSDNTPLVAAAVRDGSMRLLSWTGELLATAPLYEQPTALAAVRSAGRRLILAGTDDGRLRVWDAEAGFQLISVMQSGPSEIVAIAGTELDGMPHALAIDAAGIAHLWDVGAGTKRIGFPVPSRSGDATVQAGQDLLILGVHGGGGIYTSPERLSSRWLSAVRQAIPELNAELRVAYYADLLRPSQEDLGSGDAVAMAEAIDESPQTAAMAEEIATETLRRSDSPHRTAPLRRAMSWLVQRYGRASTVLLSSLLGELRVLLTDPDRRQAVRSRLTAELRAHEPNVVIAHSIGTIVAYEALWAEPGIPVDLFITLGSPLGMKSVMSTLHPAPVNGQGRRPPGVRRWVNIADPGDFVAVPRWLSERFVGIEQDLETSIGRFDAHSVSSYLSSPALAALLAQLQDE
jgi:hypothetical protein